MRRDPHAIEFYDRILAVQSDPEVKARWESYRRENDDAFAKLSDTGIEYRGYRFWPPFFCMCCGRPVSTGQWLFARGCDQPIEGMVSMGRRALAGRFEKIQGAEDIKEPIPVHSEEGKEEIIYRAERIAFESERRQSRQRDHRTTRPRPPHGGPLGKIEDAK